MTSLICGEVAATDCGIYDGEAVLQGDGVVGVCASGAQGHATGKSLTFAHVEPGVAEGLEVVLGAQRKLRLLPEPARDAVNDRQRV
ncbi:MAG TPA: glycine cleavage T C-terminal barrel domain-containing protein [Albidovulum sp.]|uniref:glycine cleavage T C-terminal barrel domain-containing protein n=1 Tax=Albidovulum sp. TaxID=1872424 RepID=UPI002CD2D2B1|nr:glycine cleavage T C-terminal barrel domain-containing protein [Albidovulum sp.]